MKILFLTDNFPPDVNAPATRTYEHCKEWVRKGVEVTVITCAPNFPQGKVYEGYKNKLIQKETIDGIKVIRVWTYITANEGFLKRIIDYISFSVSSFFAGLFVKTDIIIATSPQFFTAMSGRWLSFFKRKPWIMEIRDLWPESVKTVSAMGDSKIFTFFEWLEMRLYKNANKLVTVTDTFKEEISARGIDKEKISVVKNGANLDLYKPQGKDISLLKELNLIVDIPDDIFEIIVGSVITINPESKYATPTVGFIILGPLFLKLNIFLLPTVNGFVML